MAGGKNGWWEVWRGEDWEQEVSRRCGEEGIGSRKVVSRRCGEEGGG